MGKCAIVLKWNCSFGLSFATRARKFLLTFIQQGLQATRLRCEIRTPFGRPVVPEEYRMQAVVACCSLRLLIRCHSSLGPDTRSNSCFRSEDRMRFQRFGVLESMISTRSRGMLHCLAASTAVSLNSAEHITSLPSESLICRTSSGTVNAVDAPDTMPPALMTE
jgi:hypothetical protein